MGKRRAVMLLDVDGVLNAPRAGWSGPGRAARVTVDGMPLRLRWEPRAVAAVHRLHTTGVVEVRWCTTWCPWAGVLEDLWQLPQLGRAWTGDPPDTWRAKATAARLVVGSGRRLVWADDDLDPAEVPAEVLAAERDGRALLLRPRPSRGLRPQDVQRVEVFARAVTGPVRPFG